MSSRATFQVSGLQKQQLTLATASIAQRPSATRMSIGGEGRRTYGPTAYNPTSKYVAASPTSFAAPKILTSNATNYYSSQRISQSGRAAIASPTNFTSTYLTSNSARKSNSTIPISINSLTATRAFERSSNTAKQSSAAEPIPSTSKVAASPQTDKLNVQPPAMGELHSIYSPRVITSPSGARAVEITYDEKGERRPASIHRLTVETVAPRSSDPIVITSRSVGSQQGGRGYSEQSATGTANNLAGNIVPNLEISTSRTDHPRQPLGDAATSFGRYLNSTAGVGFHQTTSLTARGTADTRLLYGRDTLGYETVRNTDGNNSFRATLNSLQAQPWTQRDTQDTFIREVRGGSTIAPYMNASAPRAAAVSGLLTDRARTTNPSSELDEHARQTGLTDQIRRELRRLGLESEVGHVIRRVTTCTIQTQSHHADALLKDRVADLEEKVELKRERYFALLEVGY
jgi:hypothetical protein